MSSTFVPISKIENSRNRTFNKRISIPDTLTKAYDLLALKGTSWIFGQSWLANPDPLLSSGRIYIGRMNDELLVRADLCDAHVITKSFPINFPAFTECDVFEIFLGLTGSRKYYEFHITPSNSILQLFFDNESNGQSKTGVQVDFPLFFGGTCFTRHTWSVICRIPLQNLFPCNPQLDLSFGRYDYLMGTSTPVISSTSKHTVCDFHRRSEWNKVIFSELPVIPIS